jgi:LmbE family N-acetylglucosaminyl deacetylase
VSEQKEQKVAVVVVAHPDDAEFGAAGTVATWVSEGWEVHYVICTDASGGGADDAADVGAEARKVISGIRKGEQRAACDVLGVRDVVFLDYPDGLLQPSVELRRALVRIFRRLRPSRVLCQSPQRTWTPAYSIGRYHPDHLAAGEATIAAVYPATQNGWDFPELLEEGLLPHKISEVYFMGAPNPNVAIDISEHWQKKVAALRAHSSQLAAHFDELIAFFEARSADLGAKYAMAYAEEFHRAENR